MRFMLFQSARVLEADKGITMKKTDFTTTDFMVAISSGAENLEIEDLVRENVCTFKRGEADLRI